MAEISLSEVARLVAAVNKARGWSEGPGQAAAASGDAAERRLEDLFGVSRTLAVYGTLAPGRPNHHVVAPLGGEWSEGVIEGDLAPEGWGAKLGYPAFRPRLGGAVVPVQLLTSPALTAAWPELDRFEGPEYRRILVPVFGAGPDGDGQLSTVANVYAAAATSPGAPR
jgi:gamma-glutamylcyclotransferase (GGCT)/AIG2-like uncharacterized protein YtfP